jgi:hypothetical protein
MSTPCLRSPAAAAPAAWVCVLALALFAETSANAQIVLSTEAAQLTVEGYANFSAGDADRSGGAAGDDARFDGGARILSRLRFDDWPDVGVRVAAEVSEKDAELTEVSVLLFGGNGRLEIGERPGLPDVLTGYAPNNFQFTSAEFGPASGPSLDPAGRLQTLLLPAALARQLDPLVSLGVTAAMFDDRSTKILYVSPKKGGWLAGVSYADDADDEAVAELLQAGLTHENYWQQNVLRWGATYAHARAADALRQSRDVSSIGAGISLTLDDALMFGVAASYDGRSRLPSSAVGPFASPAWGATISVNYNTGPWTVGAYYQHTTAEGDSTLARNDQLSAFEAGASYRFTTKMRLYGAWYRYDFEDDDVSAEGLSGAGNVIILGLRVTL